MESVGLFPPDQPEFIPVFAGMTEGAYARGVFTPADG